MEINQMKTLLYLLFIFLVNPLNAREGIFIIDQKCSKIIEIRKFIYTTKPWFEVSYPQVYCKVRKNCLSALNEILKRNAMSGLDYLKQIYELEEYPEEAAGIYYFSLDYTFECNSFGYINIVIDEHSFLTGIPPFKWDNTYLFRLDQKRLLNLNDLVYTTPEFWDFLSKEISQSVNARNAEMPKEKDFNKFTLSDTYLKFIFDPNVLDPNYGASFEGNIPISRIQKFLKPEIKKIYNLK